LLSASVPPSLYAYCKAVRGPQAADECVSLQRSDLVFVVAVFLCINFGVCGSTVGEG